MQSAFLIFFTLVWSAFVLLFDGAMARGFFKQIVSQNYSIATGVVTRSEVKSNTGSKGGKSYEPVVNYRFEAGGGNFTGTRVRYGATASDSTSAYGVVAAHPKGAAVQVYYNPADPQDSVLSPGLVGLDYMLLLFLTPFNAALAGLWTWAAAWLRERLFRPVAGGVAILADGTTTRVRLPRAGAWVWGLGTTGGLAFVFTFVTAFIESLQASAGAMLTIIGLVYLAGAGVYIWKRREIQSGVDDLVINAPARGLDLPQTFGRKQRMTARIADIEGLIVETKVHSSSKGGVSYTYAPTLRLRGTEPGEQQLADWSDKQKAEDFTDWLRKQLGL